MMDSCSQVECRGARTLVCVTSLLGSILLRAGIGGAAEPLPISTSAVLSWGGPQRIFEVDLGTLPPRPVLVVEVTADAAHPDMVTEIEITDYQIPWGHPGAGTGCNFQPVTSLGGRIEQHWYNCQPAGGYPGTSATVIVSAIHFGLAEDPATVSIQIRGETRPATSTLAEQVSGPRQIVIPASKDTILYEDAPTASNGGGEFLWTGTVTQELTTGPLRNSLLAFDVASEIPSSATVNQATLALQVTNADPSWIYQTLKVHRVAPAANGADWIEGATDQPGDEFFGTSSGVTSNWFYRNSHPFFLQSWSTPGGDPVNPPVLDIWFINSPGPRARTSAELTATVQDMVATGDSNDGFVLSGPGATFPFFRRGLQFASRENPSSSQRPKLIVDYTPASTSASGEVATNVLNFIDEGQDFRWIYDLDQDDVYVTPVGGVCTVVSHPPSQSAPLPYTYSYSGAALTGVDCCTWRIDSAETGTVGTGQALFFHNLDPGNPANMPPDSDQDGIRNLCDNCPNKANGPLLGTCRIGAPLGGICRSDRDCGSGGKCSLSQEDSNGDFLGNVCVVPEPGVASGLVVGVLASVGGLVGRARSGRA